VTRASASRRTDPFVDAHRDRSSQHADKFVEAHRRRRCRASKCIAEKSSMRVVTRIGGVEAWDVHRRRSRSSRRAPTCDAASMHGDNSSVMSRCVGPFVDAHRREIVGAG
jgi:hypothetical protein